MVMANVSIILSTALIYGAYKSAMVDGFQIGFTVLFAITGLIRFVCSVVSLAHLMKHFHGHLNFGLNQY